MESISLQNYFVLLRRRKRSFFCGSMAILVLAVAFAFLWPPKYQSSGTIEIDQPDIPANFTVPAGQTASDALIDLENQHIQQIAERILTSTNLIDIISKYNLYSEQRATLPISVVAAKMRKQVGVRLVNIDIGAAASASANPTVIAFSISFNYNNPLLTQQVTNELVTRFLDEDLRQRQQKVDATSDFLAKQISDMEASLADQEKRMSAFRAQHAGSRSEDLAFNMQMAASTAQSADSLGQQLSALQQQRGSLQASLSTAYPYTTVLTAAGANGTIQPTLTSPAMQLKSLQAQYASLQGQYGPKYPDVVRLKEQISALEVYLHDDKNAADINAQISDVTSRLAVAKRTYGTNYPDVHRLENELVSLRDQARYIKPQPADPLNVQDADSPTYLVLKSQLNALDAQEKILRTTLVQTQQQHELYALRVAEAPAVERDYSQLSRDYDNAQLRYRDLKEKKLSADMNQQLQKNRSGERLVMIEPPELPNSPHFPNRPIVLALGVVVSAFGGLGGAHLEEALSSTVHGSRHLIEISGEPPLAVIPRIKSSGDERRTKLKLFIIAGVIILAIVLILVLVDQFIMPLDVLWAVIGQRL